MKKRLRAYFAEKTASAAKRGTRLRDGDRPNGATFTDLLASIVFKTEGDDRAKEDDSLTAIADLNGHVVAATDTQAKANQAKKTDRTLVAQPSQLPTVVADATASSLTYKALDASYVESSVTHADKLVEVAADNTSTRNNFVVNLFSGFITFLQGLTASFNDIVDKVKAINTRVNTNASAIGTLQGAVGGNFDQLLPIGSTSFHLNPGYSSDALWKPADGLTVVSKYVTPGNAGSGNAPIYELLSNSLQGGFTLGNAPDADYFLLPDLSGHMAYQELTGSTYQLGRTFGKWGIDITEQNLPNHTHGRGSLSAGANGSNHTHTWTNGTPDNITQYREGDPQSGSGVNVVQGTATDITSSGSHTHDITGITALGGGISSPNTATFTPPKLGGGYLIKIA